MKAQEALKLRRIITPEELPAEAVFYSFTGTEWGRNCVNYWKLYDKDLNLIECVQIAYTNVLKKLTHVSDENDPHDFKPAKLIYHFTGKKIKNFHVIAPGP